jgi:hypothetical protein
LLGLVTNAIKEEETSPNETLYQRYGYAEASEPDHVQIPASSAGWMPSQLLTLRKQGKALLHWIDG